MATSMSVLERLFVGWCHTSLNTMVATCFCRHGGRRKVRFDVRKNQEQTNSATSQKHNFLYSCTPTSTHEVHHQPACQPIPAPIPPMVVYTVPSSASHESFLPDGPKLVYMISAAIALCYTSHDAFHPLFTPQITFCLQITQKCTWTLSIGILCSLCSTAL